MHYGDKLQLMTNSLEVIIYKHEDLTVSGKQKADYQLTSIQECCYVHPKTLMNFLKNPITKEIKEKLKDKDFESWYKIYMKETKNGLEVITTMKVDHIKGLTKLH